MKRDFSDFDVANFLKTEKDCDEYFTAAQELCDPTTVVKAKEYIARARDRMKNHEG